VKINIMERRIPGMGMHEEKDTMWTTEELRNFKITNWESIADLQAAARGIQENKQGIIVNAGRQEWESVKKVSKEGAEGIVWMRK